MHGDLDIRLETLEPDQQRLVLEYARHAWITARRIGTIPNPEYPNPAFLGNPDVQPQFLLDETRYVYSGEIRAQLDVLLRGGLMRELECGSSRLVPMLNESMLFEQQCGSNSGSRRTYVGDINAAIDGLYRELGLDIRRGPLLDGIKWTRKA